MDERNNKTNRSVAVTDIWNSITDVKKKNEALDELKDDPNFSVFESVVPKLADVVDESEKDELEKWIEGFDTDFLLNEALLVLKDMSDESSNN